MNAAIRVVVADDHKPMRAGVRGALEGHGFEVVGEAQDSRGAVEAVLRERPDAVLLEVDLPGGGIRAAAEISDGAPNTAVIMLTSSSRDEDLLDSLRAGALGYLLKDTNPDRLPHAVRGVLAGEAAIPRRLVARLVEEFRGRATRRLRVGRHGAVELTAREWQVLELLRGGLDTAEIARRLDVSPVTVRRHISALLHKLGVPDRESAVRLLDHRSND